MSTTAADPPLPLVSVVMPVRNESEFIAESLGAVLTQDYPAGRLEVLVVDGGSDDDTRQVVARLATEHPGVEVRVLDNPGRTAPHALNIGIAAARGEVIQRVDGHCVIGPEHLRRAVAALAEPRVGCVGGPVETIGSSGTGRAIAAAMSSRFGVGGTAFRVGRKRPESVDTVPFPTFRREVLERAGPFDPQLTRNQDDEYSYRLRDLGYEVRLLPELRSRYYSRAGFASLARQYFQYGYWKVPVLRRHPRQAHPRQLLPALFVIGLLCGALLAAREPRLLVFVATAYLVASLAQASLLVGRGRWVDLLLLPLIFLTLHLAYGTGSLLGLLGELRRDRGLRRTALVLLAPVVLAQCFWLLLPSGMRANESSDFEAHYLPVAESLLAGRGLELEGGRPATRYPPGFSVGLALVLGLGRALGVADEVGLRLACLLGFGVTGACVFGIGRLCFDPRGAILALLIWSTYPPMLWLSKQPNSELLFLPLVACAALIYLGASVRRSWSTGTAVALGGLTGAAMLVRPAGIGLGVLFAALILFSGRVAPLSRRLRLATVILSTCLLVVLPWQIWLSSQTQGLAVLSTGGGPSVVDGLTFGVAGGFRQPLNLPDDVVELQRSLRRVAEESGAGSALARFFEEGRENPSPLFELLLIKAARSWYATDSRRFEGSLALVQVVYVALICWGGRAAFKDPARGRALLVVAGALVGYSWLTTIAALSILRYMAPSIGLALVLIPFGLGQRLRSTRGAPTAP